MLAYGVLCYAVCLAVFVYGVGFIGGFLTPTMLDGATHRPLGTAVAIDLGLLLILFALQHGRWSRIMPQAAERSTCVLVGSLALAALFACWQPLGGVVWQASSPGARTVIITWYFCGWVLLLHAAFLIDSFDLFGLKQVWRDFVGRAAGTPPSGTPTLYQLVRQPIYIGWLTIFWAAPTMTAAHLLLALLTTAYILIGIRLEERDALSAFDAAYIEYRER